MRCGPVPALAIFASLLSAGCTAGQAANHGGGHPASAAAASAVATASPAASGSLTTVHIGRYTEEFAGPVPTDAAQASVIAGFREAEVLWNKSEQAMHLVSPVTQFVLGDALAHLNDAIAHGKQNEIIIVGTDEFFMTKVTNLTASTATVTTCDNGSKLTGMDPVTGQIDNTYAPTADQAYLLENWNMVQSSGHWAISSFSVIGLPDQRAKPCQP